MKVYPFLIFVSLSLSLTSINADQASMDKLIAKEQANVDNEAVKVYGGSVGKLEAVFHIEWAGEKIFGWYYYPSRGRDKRYQLQGTNPKEGVITLQEFTPANNGTHEHTASCRLTKKVSSSRITWQGEMNNTDGRVLPMQFSRTL